MKNELLIPAKNALLLVFLVLVNACVPAVKTVFLTANVKGVVIDAMSLKPAPDIFIAQQYENKDVASASTDKYGKFELAAKTEVQFKLLMPGHSLMNYTLVTSFQGITNHHTYKTTRVMYSKRTIIDEIVFIDSEPSIIAPPPETNYKVTQQWHKDIKSDTFSSCNADKGKRVMNQLAIARKVFTHGNSDLSGLAYNQLLLSSDDFYNSCKADPLLKQKIYEELQPMNKEASTYAIDRTQLF